VKSIERLAPVIQHYAWGSVDAIPHVLGQEPDGRPWAEMWLGDHQAAPSTLPDRGGAPLDEHLPFLLKLLAAASPLSLQAHPTREQAVAGFDREEAAGIALDAPHRTYKDRNHKPELLCALTPFTALCGFREPGESAATIRSMQVAALAPLIEALDAGRLDAAMSWLLSRSAEDAAAVSAGVARADAADDWTRRLAGDHPGDIGVVTALLLNRITLAPGEAIYLGPGTLHAYLEGLGVELMASSDNVVRGGLTSKHVDTAELQRILTMAPTRPHMVHSSRVDAVTETWPTPAAEFQLWRLHLGNDVHVITTCGPEVLLCLAGTAIVEAATLPTGEAMYVPADVKRYAVQGPATVYRATVGKPSATATRA
jgi:mannose-6-phosphate isomerase